MALSVPVSIGGNAVLTFGNDARDRGGPVLKFDLEAQLPLIELVEAIASFQKAIDVEATMTPEREEGRAPAVETTTGSSARAHGQRPGDQFEVILFAANRSAGDFGFQCFSLVNDSLRICGLIAGSVSDMNPLVRVGDRIVGVNSITSPKQMLEIIRTATSVRLTIKRSKKRPAQLSEDSQMDEPNNPETQMWETLVQNISKERVERSMETIAEEEEEEPVKEQSEADEFEDAKSNGEVPAALNPAACPPLPRTLSMTQRMMNAPPPCPPPPPLLAVEQPAQQRIAPGPQATGGKMISQEDIAQLARMIARVSDEDESVGAEHWLGSASAAKGDAYAGGEGQEPTSTSKDIEAGSIAAPKHLVTKGSNATDGKGKGQQTGFIGQANPHIFNPKSGGEVQNEDQAPTTWSKGKDEKYVETEGARWQ